MVVNMKPEKENIKLRVQTTLDDLIREHLIPFKLTACGVNVDGPGKYIVPFHDSRIHSFEFSWIDGGGLSFKDIVRAAVLKRVAGMDGPPNGWSHAARKSLSSKREQSNRSPLLVYSGC
jgi:hypothetical protein